MQLTDVVEAKEGRLMVWTCAEEGQVTYCISGRMLRFDLAGRRSREEI